MWLGMIELSLSANHELGCTLYGIVLGDRHGFTTYETPEFVQERFCHCHLKMLVLKISHAR